MISDKQLISEALSLLGEGVYAPDDLFKKIYRRGVHYARVRKAIHIAKTR
jgi:hypothetical protein